MMLKTCKRRSIHHVQAVAPAANDVCCGRCDREKGNFPFRLVSLKAPAATGKRCRFISFHPKAPLLLQYVIIHAPLVHPVNQVAASQACKIVLMRLDAFFLPRQLQLPLADPIWRAQVPPNHAVSRLVSISSTTAPLHGPLPEMFLIYVFVGVLSNEYGFWKVAITWASWHLVKRVCLQILST